MVFLEDDGVCLKTRALYHPTLQIKPVRLDPARKSYCEGEKPVVLTWYHLTVESRSCGNHLVGFCFKPILHSPQWFGGFRGLWWFGPSRKKYTEDQVDHNMEVTGCLGMLADCLFLIVWICFSFFFGLMLDSYY